MNEKVIEKLKDANFFKEIVTIGDEGKVKEMFKKENIDINDEDLNDIGNFIGVSLEVASKLSGEELEKVSAGHKDSVVYALSDQLRDWAVTKDDQYGCNPDNWNTKRYKWIYDHSDKITEGALATAIVGLSVGGTLGIQKLIKTGKEKAWWTKDYWVKKK